MRDASQAPRNSRELAVRNQFFTPRYVVEFLVDNTLGRLWFNATGGDTHLRERCQYLLVKPDETPQAATKLRDPRTLKLLDPACGSMHFGLYAFDLFAEIYREAWAWEQQHGPGSLDVSTLHQTAFDPLSQTYEEEAVFLRDVPRLIIEHNIYGVDIDPRAAQIASLALWLRAQRAWHDAGVKAKDRPLIGRGHVVAAIAPPAERELRQQFATGLDKRDADLFEKTLELLKGLPELGVLLQVERELPHLIRQVYVGKGTGLFATQEQEGWRQAEERLRTALTEFAQASKSTYQGRLFAQDALIGLRLVDLMSDKFDVIVMNPPFGAVSESTKEYIFDKHPIDKTEIAACFVSRCRQLLQEKGFLGAITNRTFLFSESFQEWRGKFLTDIDVCADLGFGVLDALVETAAYTITPGCTDDAVFVALTNSSSKESDLLNAILQQFNSGIGQERLVRRSRLSLSDFGTEWFYYWLSEKFLSTATSVEARKAGLIAKPGLQTCDNYRFVRLAWECVPDCEFAGSWPRLSKGGEYQPFWPDIHLVVNWKSNGKEMKAFIENSYESWSKQIPSVNLYFKPGLTYSERTTSSLSLRILPEGCLFDKQGPFIGFQSSETDIEDLTLLLGLSYSYVFKCLVESRVGLRDATAAGSPARHYMPSMIERLPLPTLDRSQRIEIKEWVRLCAEVHMQLGSLNVADSFFFGFPELSSSSSITEYHSKLGRKIAGKMQKLYQGLEIANRMMSEKFELDERAEHELEIIFGPEFKEQILGQKYFGSVDELVCLSESELVAQVCAKVGQFSSVLKQSFVGNRKIELVSLLLESSPIDILKNVGSFEWLISSSEMAENLIEYFVGIIFGRWDIRTCLSNDYRTDISNLFAPIPICPPAQLKDEAGVPFRERSKGLLYTNGSNYPFSVNWNGVLVDDPGNDFHIFSQLQKVIESIWISAQPPSRTQAIEGEICQALNYRELHEFFRATSGFFDSHLKRHSKSRRKAPIYWPLSTTSGSYTLWVYYHSLNSQTLYTAINDFVEPKLKQVGADVTLQRNKGAARTRDDEKKFEALQTLELELIELRDTLLNLAPTYKPNHDDGVEISAAPLWPLFRHKPWRKALKDTLAKLEKGDYDWAHLAMNYWPDRVQEKCKTDKSLAIAHGLEDRYIEPEAKPKKARGKKKARGDE